MGEIGGVPLGDRRHDAVLELSSGGGIDVLSCGNESDPGAGEL